MWNVIQEVAALISVQYLEAGSQVMVLKDAVIAVSNGKGMLGAHDELV